MNILHIIDTLFDKAMDAAIDHSGCTIAGLIGSVILVVILFIGVAACDSYAHRNQNCIHATREYICLQWQDN